MEYKDLQKVLDDHELWLEDATKGKRMDIRGVDLGFIYDDSSEEGLEKGRFDFRNKDLRGARLEDVDLSDCDLQGIDLSNSTLIKVDFSGSVLSGANFSWAQLKKVNFSRSNLSGTDFTGTKELSLISPALLRSPLLRFLRFLFDSFIGRKVQFDA